MAGNSKDSKILAYKDMVNITVRQALPQLSVLALLA